MKNMQQIVEQPVQGQAHRHEWFRLDSARHRVLVYPTWAGITDFERSIAQRLNASGLEAVIVDFFGSGHDLSTIETRREAMLSYTRDFTGMTAHLQVLNDWILNRLQDQPGCTFVTRSLLGFCLGGMCALISGQTQRGFTNAISFHGLLSFPKEAPPQDLATRFMILNGQADPMVSAKDIHATQDYFETHQQELTFINFSRTLHSFSIPGVDNPQNGVQYKPEVAERSWRYALDLLQHPA